MVFLPYTSTLSEYRNMLSKLITERQASINALGDKTHLAIHEDILQRNRKLLSEADTLLQPVTRIAGFEHQVQYW